jgi:hypothetical protein
MSESLMGWYRSVTSPKGAAVGQRATTRSDSLGTLTCSYEDKWTLRAFKIHVWAVGDGGGHGQASFLAETRLLEQFVTGTPNLSCHADQPVERGVYLECRIADGRYSCLDTDAPDASSATVTLDGPLVTLGRPSLLVRARGVTLTTPSPSDIYVGRESDKTESPFRKLEELYGRFRNLLPQASDEYQKEKNTIRTPAAVTGVRG